MQNDQPGIRQTQQPIQHQTTQPPQELHPWDEAIQVRNSYPNESQPSVPDGTTETTQTTNQPQPTAHTYQPTVSSTPTTTAIPPTVDFLQLLNQPINPPHIQTISRRKRHWLSQAFSDLTGLATQTDLIF